MTYGVDIRHKNLLRRSFNYHMVPQRGMRVYPENNSLRRKMKNQR